MQPRHRRFWSFLKCVLTHEHAQDMAEYALVVSLVAFGAVASLQSLAGGMNTALSGISTTLETYVASSGSPSAGNTGGGNSGSGSNGGGNNGGGGRHGGGGGRGGGGWGGGRGGGGWGGGGRGGGGWGGGRGRGRGGF